MKMWTYNYTYPSELYHYGVKGMKWGVRRYQNKDGSLTSEGRKRYNEEQKTNEKENRFGLSEKQKKYIKNGAIAVGVALAAYGTYKIADSGVYRQWVDSIRQPVEMFTKGSTSIVNFKRNDELSKPMSADQIAKTFFGKINPGYRSYSTKASSFEEVKELIKNRTFDVATGTGNNCRRCTFAYELSRRGFDVKATKSFGSTGQSGKNVFRSVLWDRDNKGHMFEKINLFDSTGKFTPDKSIFSDLSKMPDRARGELTLGWKHGGGHSVAWEIINNTPVIFDFQTGTMYKDEKSFFDFINACGIKDASFTRLDDKDLDFNFLKRWVKND